VETARRLIGIALLCAASVNCSFERVPPQGGGDDGGVDDGGVDAKIPDAGMCPATSAMCVTDMMLRECQQVGQLPVDTPCPWGCLGTGTAHCGQIQPTGTVVMPTDLMPNPALLNISAALAMGTGTINTDDGSITNVRTAGTGIRSGIDFQVRTFDGGAAGTRSVGVLRLGKLALTGNWLIRGTNALVIVSLGDVTLQGRFDLRGDCAGQNAGPGGFPGGASGTDAAGLGGGKAGVPSGGDSSGGGGGGRGAEGGGGGRAPSSPGNGRPAGGMLFGDEQIPLLLGGGGGGGGGNGGRGGGGGGAIYIVANGKVTVRAQADLMPSGINAGGCGGERSNQNSGGGGGAGGAILIEATELELDGAYLAVNGGGGGAAGAGGATGDGADGDFGTARAAGGTGTANGGEGGAAGNLAGEAGMDGTDSGGGGGAVGRIRVHTRTTTGVTVKNGADVSPRFGEPGSTATKGLATIQ
jgi:hypothetical protein